MELSDLLDIAEAERRARPPHRIRVCTAASCLPAGSEAVVGRLRETVREHGLGERVGVAAVGCMRLCCQGPLVRVDPGDELYQQVTPDDLASLVAGIDGGTVTAKRGDPHAPLANASTLLSRVGMPPMPCSAG